MLNQSKLGNWLPLNAKLNISSFDLLLGGGGTLRPDIMLLILQCGGNLTLLGLHRRIPVVNIVTNNNGYTYCKNLAKKMILYMHGMTKEQITSATQTC